MKKQTKEHFELSVELADNVFNEKMLFTISKGDCASDQTLKFPNIVEVKKSSEKIKLPQFKRRQNYFLKLSDIVKECNENLAGMFYNIFYL